MASSEEQQHLLQAFDQVADHLGEAGDVDADVVALVACAQGSTWRDRPP
jgi:hypothetical protein